MITKSEFLTADQILATEPRIFKVVDVPEWGGKVRVRSLTGKERDEFEAGLSETRGSKTKSNFKNFRAKMVAICAVDAEGELLFPHRYQVDKLGEKSVAALQRVFNVCQALNGMSDEDVDSLTEDFGPDPDELSTSD